MRFMPGHCLQLRPWFSRGYGGRLILNIEIEDQPAVFWKGSGFCSIDQFETGCFLFYTASFPDIEIDYGRSTIDRITIFLYGISDNFPTGSGDEITMSTFVSEISEETQDRYIQSIREAVDHFNHSFGLVEEGENIGRFFN